MLPLISFPISAVSMAVKISPGRLGICKTCTNCMLISLTCSHFGTSQTGCLHMVCKSGRKDIIMPSQLGCYSLLSVQHTTAMVQLRYKELVLILVVCTRAVGDSSPGPVSITSIPCRWMSRRTVFLDAPQLSCEGAGVQPGRPEPLAGRIRRGQKVNIVSSRFQSDGLYIRIYILTSSPFLSLSLSLSHTHSMPLLLHTNYSTVLL